MSFKDFKNKKNNKEPNGKKGFKEALMNAKGKSKKGKPETQEAEDFIPKKFKLKKKASKEEE